MYISLNGAIIVNLSVPITTIGDRAEEALLCFTDLYHFCTDCSELVGQWYFPNGSMVKDDAHGGTLYMSRSRGVVRLHRRNNVNTPTGLYHCEIMNSSRTNQNISVDVYSESTSTTLSTPPVTVATGIVGNGAAVGGGVAGGLLLLAAGIVLIILSIWR